MLARSLAAWMLTLSNFGAVGTTFALGLSLAAAPIIELLIAGAAVGDPRPLRTLAAVNRNALGALLLALPLLSVPTLLAPMIDDAAVPPMLAVAYGALRAGGDTSVA